MLTVSRQRSYCHLERLAEESLPTNSLALLSKNRQQPSRENINNGARSKLYMLALLLISVIITKVSHGIKDKERQLEVYAFETDSQAMGFKYLQLSASRFGVTLINIGEKEQWMGWSFRLIKLRDSLLNSRIADEDYICFVDGRDVLITDSEENIIYQIDDMMLGRNSKSTLIAAFNLNVRPEVEESLQQKFGLCQNVRVNAGSWCATKYAALSYIDLAIHEYRIDKPENFQVDDQIMMTKICRKNPEMFVIDVNRDLIYCEANCTKPAALDTEEGVIRGEIEAEQVARNAAGFAHIPGNTNVENLYVYYGYDSTSFSKE